MPGIGKTGFSHRIVHGFKAVLRVSADSRVKLSQDFVEIAKAKSLSDSAVTDDAAESIAFV